MDGSETPAGAFGGLPIFSSELAIDPATGDFYVPDFSNSVVDDSGRAANSTNLDEGQIEVSLPSSVAVDASTGDVYVTQIFDFNTFTPHVSTFTPQERRLPRRPSKPSPRNRRRSLLAGRRWSSTGAEAGSTSTRAVKKKPKWSSTYGTGHLLGTLDPDPAHSLALDPGSGTIYADEGSQIAQYDPSGERLGTTGAGHLSESLGVTLDPGGSLYAANGTKVAVFPAALAPSSLIDSPVVVDSVSASESRHTGEFQTNAGGDAAAFASTIPW